MDLAPAEPVWRSMLTVVEVRTHREREPMKKFAAAMSRLALLLAEEQGSEWTFEEVHADSVFFEKSTLTPVFPDGGVAVVRCSVRHIRSSASWPIPRTRRVVQLAKRLFARPRTGR